MPSLTAPGLSLLLLFRARHPAGEHPEAPLVKRLGLERESTQEAERSYRGALGDGTTCRVRAALAHDTHVVRCDLALDGVHPPAEAWERLTRHGEALLNACRDDGDLLTWGATWLYHAVLPPSLSPDAVPDFFDGLPLPAPGPSGPALEATPFGWLGWLGEGERPPKPPSTCRERRLLLAVPSERVEKVARYFLNPLTQGWTRIERHLHKAIHHARLQKEASQALGQAIVDLRAQMAAAVSKTDLAHPYRESQELERVSVLLMNFLNQKAHAEMVLQSLRVNLHDLGEALEEVRLVTPLYEREKQQLARQAEQLQSDLEYARVVTESTYAFQEMQRGIENNRLQRASLMLTTASALLAGFTIFNSFLDIWALILADSDWRLPPMGLRLVLGAVAGISLPIAAYMGIERRYRPLILWGGLFLLSVLLAVLSTIGVNR